MKRFVLVAAAVLVSSCAALAPPLAPIALDGLPSSFEMSGRLSVAQAGRGDIARLRWTHAPATDLWVLASPVGTELARIERSGEGLVVERPGEAAVRAASFSRLSEQLLGAAIDERLLIAWLHGRPLAGPEGWRVTIDESQRLGDRDIARRITASRDEVTVKLVVDAYRVVAE
jgi:outer membrane biogenesis lipoprotein LolB